MQIFGAEAGQLAHVLVAGVQTRELLQVPAQQGAPTAVPHVAQLPAVLQARVLTLHVPPAPPQQCWLRLPHSQRLLVGLQLRLPTHDDPAQHGCPAVWPHVLQEVFGAVPVQTRVAVLLQVMPLQQACPLFPHWHWVPPAHVRLALQVMPLQHACVLAPHWHVLPGVTQVKFVLQTPAQQGPGVPLIDPPQVWQIPLLLQARVAAQAAPVVQHACPLPPHAHVPVESQVRPELHPPVQHG